jgi:hypothetical protein
MLCLFFQSCPVKSDDKDKIPNFTSSDVLFLKEYAQVMCHVAISLEMLQGEEQAYLGCLLPTLAVLTMNLRKVFNNMTLAYCRPLVQALLDGAYKRFDSLFEDKECQLAAAFPPRFRLLWIRDCEALAKRVTQSMEDVVEVGYKSLQRSSCQVPVTQVLRR